MTRIPRGLRSSKSRQASYVPDEEFKKVLPVTPKNVLKAIDHYVGEYKAPASISDVQFILSIPHGSKVDKEIDRSLAKAPPAKVLTAIDKLKSEGLVKISEHGGYTITPEGRKQIG